MVLVMSQTIDFHNSNEDISSEKCELTPLSNIDELQESENDNFDRYQNIPWVDDTFVNNKESNETGGYRTDDMGENGTQKANNSKRSKSKLRNGSFGKRGKSKSGLVPSKSIKRNIREYCTSTSIHGVKYLAERDRPIVERDKRTHDVALLCDDIIRMQEGSDITDNSTLDFLLEVALSIHNMSLVCKWKHFRPCAHVASQIITEEGFCISFNILDSKDLFRGKGIPYFFDREDPYNYNPAKDWTLEHGYPASSNVKASYPFRAAGAGARSEFTVLLRARFEDNDYLCRITEGFKVLLHNPAEIPAIKDLYVRIPLRTETVIAVKPNIMTTSDNLKPYSPKVRQCYFPSERYLAHFKVYTQKNCELECLTNFTLKFCGCVAIHMPRDDDTPICGIGKKDCYVQASEELRETGLLEESGYKNMSSCNCLPSCVSIEYDGESSMTDFDLHKLARSLGGIANLTKTEKEILYGSDMAKVTIFFKESQFTTIKRTELYGLVDFLANCGGLLGLFLGVSLLSFVEIFYYATVRCFINLTLGKKKMGTESNAP